MGKHADRVIEINPDKLVIALVGRDLANYFRLNEYTPLFEPSVFLS